MVSMVFFDSGLGFLGGVDVMGLSGNLGRWKVGGWHSRWQEGVWEEFGAIGGGDLGGEVGWDIGGMRVGRQAS